MERKNLSSTLRQMKFMQRKRKYSGGDNQQKKEESVAKASTSQSASGGVVVASLKKPRFISQQNYSIVEDLAYGRMSFQGFNSEVEKLMTHYNAIAKGDAIEEDADISAREVADRYMNLKKKRDEEDVIIESSDKQDIIDVSDSPSSYTATGNPKQHKRQFKKPK